MSATTTPPTFAELSERYVAAKASYTEAASEIARTGKGDSARIRELSDALEVARAAVDGYPAVAAERQREARAAMLADLDIQIRTDLDATALREKEATLREALTDYLAEAARLDAAYGTRFNQILGLGAAQGFEVASTIHNARIATPSGTYARHPTSDRLGAMLAEAWRESMNGEPADFLR